MKKRVQIIEEAKPEIAISIHQNSFTDSSSRGAQVFFYTDSEKSQRLANILQETLIEKIADDNHRAAKENNSYYLLKKTSCPIAIVECGFLSNASDAALLVTEEYQNKIAEAICEGILTYLTIQE